MTTAEEKAKRIVLAAQEAISKLVGKNLFEPTTFEEAQASIKDAVMRSLSDLGVPNDVAISVEPHPEDPSMVKLVFAGKNARGDKFLLEQLEKMNAQKDG